METQGHLGTPKAARSAKGSTFARRRRSTAVLIFAVALLATLAVAPQLARAQQWPSSDAPDPGFPQLHFPSGTPSSALDAGDVNPNDPLFSTNANGMLHMMPVDNSRLIDAESCEMWTAASVNSPTVSVARLEVPGNASHEFQKACGNFKDKRLKPAEEHAREAAKIYPDYAAAWVLLGQILEADHRDNDAIQACRKAESVDPEYAPSYLCLAGFAAVANDWDEAFSLANRALSLDPATDPYAFLYTAEAEYHLRRLDKAEFYALSAEKLDKWNHLPNVHLLLAEVYNAERDRAREERELRKFVKNSPHNTDWATARTTLAEIEEIVPAK